MPVTTLRLSLVCGQICARSCFCGPSSLVLGLLPSTSLGRCSEIGKAQAELNYVQNYIYKYFFFLCIVLCEIDARPRRRVLVCVALLYSLAPINNRASALAVTPKEVLRKGTSHPQALVVLLSEFLQRPPFA